MKNVLAPRVVSVPPSGIRKFFDIADTNPGLFWVWLDAPQADREQALLVPAGRIEIESGFSRCLPGKLLL